MPSSPASEALTLADFTTPVATHIAFLTIRSAAPASVAETAAMLAAPIPTTIIIGRPAL
jgi:hypothetical protein